MLAAYHPVADSMRKRGRDEKQIAPRPLAPSAIRYTVSPLGSASSASGVEIRKAKRLGVLPCQMAYGQGS